MNVDPATGMLDEAEQVASPNHDARPDDSQISLVVVHGISLPPGEFGGPYIEQLFTNSLDPDEHDYFREIHQLQVSSHLLIRRDGTIIQFVPFSERAWHAGQSSYNGVSRCNDYSIGIELEGTDEIPYTDSQYTVLGEIIHTLQASYPEIGNNIAGHSDIAPGRKTDPGPVFQWDRLEKILQQKKYN